MPHFGMYSIQIPGIVCRTICWLPIPIAWFGRYSNFLCRALIRTGKRVPQTPYQEWMMSKTYDSNVPLGTIAERTRIFTGNYLKLDRVDVCLPDTRIAAREIVCVRHAVAVLPMDSNGRVHLVRQYRPAIDRTIVEIPAGLIDSDETPEEAAARECEEETGYRPRYLRKLIYYAHAEGYSTGFITAYAGTDLVFTGIDNPDSTEILDRIEMSFDALLAAISSGDIVDSKTILSTVLTRDLISGGLFKYT